MRPRDLFMGPRGSIRGLPRVPGGQEGIQGIPWGHRVGLMSLLMIYKAYMPVYSDPDFSCGTDGTGRTNQPKVVQEVLADLKMKENRPGCSHLWPHKTVELLFAGRQTRSLPPALLYLFNPIPPQHFVI